MEIYKGNKPWVTVFGCLVVFIGLPVTILTYGELDQGDFFNRFFGEFSFALIVLNIINTIGAISYGLIWLYFYYKRSELEGNISEPTKDEKIKCLLYSLWITITLLFLRKAIRAFLINLPTEMWGGIIFILYLLLTLLIIVSLFSKSNKKQ